MEFCINWDVRHGSKCYIVHLRKNVDNRESKFLKETEEICKELKVPFDRYAAAGIHFGAYSDHDSSLVFEFEKDAKNFIEFLKPILIFLHFNLI
jgi:hypothetical protein